MQALIVLCILEFSQVGSDEVCDAWHNEQGLRIEVAGAPVITRQPIITLASKSAGGSVFFWPSWSKWRISPIMILGHSLFEPKIAPKKILKTF